MCGTRFLGTVAMALLAVVGTALGQNATLSLVTSQSSINAGGQVTVEAFIENLPVTLRGYQIGLEITGGASGTIKAAQFTDSVVVDETRSDWVFRELADTGETVLSAGRNVDFLPPALLALFFHDIGAQPPNKRYLGTFVLEASSDAAGDFEIGITPPDPADSTSETILVTVGGGIPTFPADVNDPTIIPVTATPSFLTVQNPNAVPAVSEWGLFAMAIVVLIAGTIAIRTAQRRVYNGHNPTQAHQPTGG